MISKREFEDQWAVLEKRFNREHDPVVIRGYYELLSECMDTDEFKAACRHLFFTATWFPRPVDFLLVEAEEQWNLLFTAIGLFTPRSADWTVPWKKMSVAARSAATQIGGVRLLQDKDPIRLKKAFLEALEADHTTAAVPVLPSPPTLKDLPPHVRKALADGS